MQRLIDGAEIWGDMYDTYFDLTDQEKEKLNRTIERDNFRG